MHGSLRSPVLVRTFRRSRLKVLVMRALARLGRAYPAHLARVVRTDARRIRQVMYGDGRAFAVGTGLVRLGLVRAEVDDGGRLVYSITARGRRVAHALSRAGWRSPARP